MKIFSNHPLLELNTFGIDVNAKEFASIDNELDLKEIIAECHDRSKKLLILGGGSNILFKDDFDGLVLHICTRGIEIIREDEDTVHLRVAAGENWDGLVEYCVGHGWGGLENLSGIPGCVGSSPIQNIGAYGAELKDHFLFLDAINRCTGETVSFDEERCQFGYRDSIFKRALKDRVVITHVAFRLNKNPVFNLDYFALKQRLGHLPENTLTLMKVREAVLQIRASKLPDPKLTGNAGSFFKNPVISNSALKELKDLFPGIVYFDSVQSGGAMAKREVQITSVKLAAAWLIDHCGWKGYREGDAGVHKDQALALVNYGRATGMDILELAGKIQQSVQEKFGINLEREVNII
jgi:UDP-N-acetylmuramate dehydrogenase